MFISVRIVLIGNAGLILLALLWVYTAMHCTWVAGEIWADHGDEWAEATNIIGWFGARVWVGMFLLSFYMVLKKSVSWKYLLLTTLLGLILWKEYFLSYSTF